MKRLLLEIRELFTDVLRELRRWQVWATTLLIAGFALLAFLVGMYAMKTDAVLSFAHLTTGYCPTLSNTTIIAMFTGMIFFILTALLTLGEVQRLFEMRQRGHQEEARLATKWAFFWGFSALFISLSALAYFMKYCF